MENQILAARHVFLGFAPRVPLPAAQKSPIRLHLGIACRRVSLETPAASSSEAGLCPSLPIFTRNAFVQTRDFCKQGHASV
jgi:hypothetical protein